MTSVTFTGSIKDIDLKEGKEKWKTKVITAVMSAVIIAALVMTGFILAFYFMHTSAKEALEVKKISFVENGEMFEEAIERSKNEDGVYKNKVSRNGKNFHILVDFNRRLVTVRTDDDGYDTCVTLPFTNELNYKDNDHRLSHTEWLASNDTETVRLYYATDHQVIRNHDIIGFDGKEMCLGYPLFWGISKEKPINKERRFKRIHHGCTDIIFHEIIKKPRN